MFDKKAYRRKYYQDNLKRENENNRKWSEDNPERRKKIRREYLKTEKGKATQRRNAKTYKDKIGKYTREYKLSKGCSVCGYNKCAAALDFHHNGDKDFNISRGESQNYGLIKIRKEIDKCIILCKNCHAELHEKV